MTRPRYIFRDLSNAVAAAVEAGHAHGRLSARTGTPLCAAELVHAWKGVTAPGSNGKFAFSVVPHSCHQLPSVSVNSDRGTLPALFCLTTPVSMSCVVVLRHIQ